MFLVHRKKAVVILGDGDVDVLCGTGDHKADGKIGILCFRKEKADKKVFSIKEVLKKFPVLIFFKSADILDDFIEKLQEIRAGMEAPDETHR